MTDDHTITDTPRLIDMADDALVAQRRFIAELLYSAAQDFTITVEELTDSELRTRQRRHTPDAVFTEPVDALSRDYRAEADSYRDLLLALGAEIQLRRQRVADARADRMEAMQQRALRGHLDG